MDKQAIKDIVKEMILDGEIRITTTYEDKYSNEGFFLGEEKALVLCVEYDDGENNWDSVKDVGQDYDHGVVLEKVENKGW